MSVDVEVLAPLALVERDGGVTFEVRVQPRATRAARGGAALVGLHDAALKVALTAPPVDGAANAALIAFIAEVLGVPKRRVQIVRGDKSRQKVVRVADITQSDVRAALALALQAP